MDIIRNKAIHKKYGGSTEDKLRDIIDGSDLLHGRPRDILLRKSDLIYVEGKK